MPLDTPTPGAPGSATSASRVAEDPPSLQLHDGALVLATIATGLMAGFFYAYEVSVTRGLALVSDTIYVETMNAINATIRNAPFGLAFFGALPLGLLALALHLRRPQAATAALIAAGVLLYGATLAITAGISIPLNDQLAAGASIPGADLAVLRAGYEGAWNSANALRTATNLAAFGALAAASAMTRRTSRFQSR